MQKVESINERLTAIEEILSTIINSGAIMGRLEENNLASAVESLRLAPSPSRVQEIKKATRLYLKI